MLSLKSILLLLTAIGGLYGAWQVARIRRRMDEPSAAGRCIACDSTSLQPTGHAAYRCITCGYEGGMGQRALAEQKAAAKYVGMDAQERQHRARRAALQALHVLMGAPLRPTKGNDPDEIVQWMAAVESCALSAMRELEEARRAAGGVIDIAGKGQLDPSALRERLRLACGGEEITLGGDARRTHQLRAVIEQVQAALHAALPDVPREPDRSASTAAELGQYRS